MNATYQRLHALLIGAAVNLERIAEDVGGGDERLTYYLRVQSERLRRWGERAIQKRRFDPLPKGQARVLACVENHIEAHGHPPTRLEIAHALGFSSPNAAEEHLRALERRGVIEMKPGISRGIRVLV